VLSKRVSEDLPEPMFPATATNAFDVVMVCSGE
jgi:hypothetical protein